MDHIAILRKAKVTKDDNLLKAILEGRKTIESRWYVNKISPWNNIKTGDPVYLKESGGPVCAVADVSKVLQFENLTADIIKHILRQYGKYIAPDASEKTLIAWADKLNVKRYCILIFLQNVRVIPHFRINKSGYGISAAWLAVQDIKRVKL